MSGPKRRPIADRFWPRVDKTDDCWLWTGGTSNRYGTMPMPPRGNRYAHRVSWELHFGPIPEGLWVLHHCDNPPCVRPDHLFLGTARDNAQDMGRKGRAGATRHPERLLRGERWHAAHPTLTHCKRGHPKIPENLNKYRHCIPCRRELNREWMRRSGGYYQRRSA